MDSLDIALHGHVYTCPPEHVSPPLITHCMHLPIYLYSKILVTVNYPLQFIQKQFHQNSKCVMGHVCTSILDAVHCRAYLCGLRSYFAHLFSCL